MNSDIAFYFSSSRVKLCDLRKHITLIIFVFILLAMTGDVCSGPLTHTISLWHLPIHLLTTAFLSRMFLLGHAWPCFCHPVSKISTQETFIFEKAWPCTVHGHAFSNINVSWVEILLTGWQKQGHGVQEADGLAVRINQLIRDIRSNHLTGMADASNRSALGGRQVFH